MTDRIFNFSPGPAVLPVSVLEQAKAEMLSLPGVGASVLEISHRGEPFKKILQSAKENLRNLLGIPDNYSILFLQGGSRLQFTMIPMNFARDAATDYLLTGTWGSKARDEAALLGETRTAWSGKEQNFVRTPTADECTFNPDAAYVHFTSNETIQGVQFANEPEVGEVPLVCDASSDFLSGPMSIEKYGMIYACAQKNAGPAGVTVVILRDDLLARSTDKMPGYLSYQLHAENDSLFNTPPSFGVYMVDLVARWLREEIGGLEKMLELNQRKASMLYDAIDGSEGFYEGHAEVDSRSIMNVPFRLPNDELQAKFLAGAQEHHLHSLKGHRSVGGIRASIYNAMPLAGVETLRDFMQDFCRSHG